MLHVTWQERGQERRLTVSTLSYESGADMMEAFQ
jgi:hypothetical protein